MARKAFLLRTDPTLLAAVQRWADADLRSLNGQIEYILRQAVLRRGVQLPAEETEVISDTSKESIPPTTSPEGEG
jgi:hypothetical protein